MIVIIEYGPGWEDSARRLARLAERLGYRVVERRSASGFRVESPAGVYSDPDRASNALAILARLVGWDSG